MGLAAHYKRWKQGQNGANGNWTERFADISSSPSFPLTEGIKHERHSRRKHRRTVAAEKEASQNRGGS